MCIRDSSCPVFGKCGGCALAHLSYDEELVQKHRFVADAMRRIGGLSCEILPILPSPCVQGYRNKAQYPLCLLYTSANTT